jgi:hypothetical protein
MLNSIEDMYKAFLDGIKKESTTTVRPDRFNRLINVAQLAWVMVNVKDVEVEQVDIDRFREILESEELETITPRFFELPDMYLRMLSTSFKVQWKAGACETGISPFLPGNYIKTNNLSISKINPYRKTNQHRLHYRLIGNYVEFIENIHCDPIACLMEYIRYPQDMKFVAVDSTDNVDCELPIHARQEVTELAVRIHLERVVDPRYKSYLNEFVINSNIK